MITLQQLTAPLQLQRTRRFRRMICIFMGITIITLYLQHHHQLMSTNSSNELANSSRQSAALVEQLEREVRIICWVMTSPKYKERAMAVKRTWGKRCQRLIFVTPQHDPDLGETVVTDEVEDAHELLWFKVQKAFRYVYQKYYHEADWFLKTDDDGYVFMENLRYFLYAYSPEMPIHFGHGFKYRNYTYFAGGCGYVLSRESVRLLVDVAFHNESACDYKNPTAVEDVEISVCLENVGAHAGDSRDIQNRWRFFPFTPSVALIASSYSKNSWFYFRTFYKPHMHGEAFSKYAIGFHYVTPSEIFMYEFMNYEFELQGIEEEYDERLPEKIHLLEVIAPPTDNEQKLLY